MGKGVDKYFLFDSKHPGAKERKATIRNGDCWSLSRIKKIPAKFSSWQEKCKQEDKEKKRKAKGRKKVVTMKSGNLATHRLCGVIC